MPIDELHVIIERLNSEKLATPNNENYYFHVKQHTLSPNSYRSVNLCDPIFSLLADYSKMIPLI